MTISDEFVVALAVWRENRGGGYEGMQSVANVIVNRAKIRKTAPYAECVWALQFSSLTAKGDPELALWPAQTDPSWTEAKYIAGAAVNGTLLDITGGATNYYATSMTTPPTFAAKMTQTVVIKNQIFFK
jgi:N-acetylmuramoyl-L-alanine amidase